MKLIHRYILSELVRVFLLTLTALTIMLVAVGIVTEASRNGFGPAQILRIIPYLIPGTMPYTIPATTLFAVSLVYGRMAGDNEVVALKSAGVPVTSVLWPSFFLAGMLSVATLGLIDRFIPWARTGVRNTVVNGMEQTIYDLLRRHRIVNHRRLDYTLAVRDVVGRRLIGPTIRFRPGKGHSVAVAQAEEATLKIDVEANRVVFHMKEVDVTTAQGVDLHFTDRVFPVQLPSEEIDIKARDLPLSEIRKRLDEVERGIDEYHEHRAVRAAFLLAQGRYEYLLEEPPRSERRQHQDLLGERARLRTELSMRWSMSSSCLFFVLVGAPVAILGRRRDFLTNFMTCFLPIMLLYYPLVLGLLNLSKYGQIRPTALWLPNLGLALLAVLVLRRVMRH